MGILKKLSYVIKGISPFGAMQYGFVGLMLSIDSLIYWVATILYSLFVGLSQVTILTNEAYQNLADRIYVLVGIVGLFVMTFTLLKAMVDPDKAGQTVIKSFKSLIISVALVILLPTIFKYAFSFQNAIIKDGVIHNLLNFKIDGSSSGEDQTLDEVCSVDKPNYTVYDEDKHEISEEPIEGTSDNKNVVRAVSESRCQGNYILVNLFSAFFIPKDSENDPENLWGTKWSDAKAYIARTGNFIYVTSFVPNASDFSNDGIIYVFLISTAAGAFAAYVLLSFCIDLGVRSFKLAFYQIIAPIPIFLRIIPGKDSYFSKWMTATLKCFLEIFVRILLIEFMIFMCKNFMPIMSVAFSGMGEVGIMGKAVLILGLFSFIKSAPKLFKEALGFEGTGVKLGLRGKVEESLPMGAAAAIGAGGIAVGRTITGGISDAKSQLSAINENDPDYASKRSKIISDTIAKTAGGAFIGGIGGMYQGARAGHDAKNFADLRKAAIGGANTYNEGRKERAKHRAQYGGVRGAIQENLRGRVEGAKSFFGVPNVIDRVKFEEEWVNAYDPFKNIYDNGEYQALTSKIDSYKASKGSIAEMRNLGFKVDEEQMRRDGKSESAIKAAYQTKVDAAIQDLYSSQQDLRKTAIMKNNAAAANSLLDLANLIKTNSAMASELGLDTHLTKEIADKITLVGDKVMYKDGDKMLDLTKKIDLNNMDSDDKRIIDTLQTIYEATTSGPNGSEGLFADRKKANDTKKNEISSGEYRQYQRRQEAQKNSK